MGLLRKIIKSKAGDIVTGINGIIDENVTSDEEKLQSKEKISKIVLDELSQLSELQAQAMAYEMNGSFLQRSWRPIIMLSFAALLIFRWTGLTTHDISDQLELKLMSIIELGLGGYVIGRSVEKISDRITQNIDMTFLKKKDRRLFK